MAELDVSPCHPKADKLGQKVSGFIPVYRYVSSGVVFILCIFLSISLMVQKSGSPVVELDSLSYLHTPFFDILLVVVRQISSNQQ